MVGAFGFDLMAFLFGEMGALSRLVHVPVGLAAVYPGLAWRAVRTRRGVREPVTA